MADLHDVIPEVTQHDEVSEDSNKVKEREQARLRKQKQRAKEKQEKEQAKEAADLGKYKTPLEYWQAQQAQLPALDVAKMLERHDDLLLLVDVMREYVQYGIGKTSQQDLDATIEEVKQEMKKGEVLMEITLIPKFWIDKPFFQSVVERGGPTATFARYGLLEALPTHSVYDFQQKFMKPTFVTPADMQEWKTLVCSQCPPERKLESSRCVPAEIAEAYGSGKAKFVCHRCRAGEAQSRKLSPQAILGNNQSDAANQLFDSFGRIRDNT